MFYVFHELISKTTQRKNSYGDDETLKYLQEKGFSLIKEYQHFNYDIYDLVLERAN